MSLVSYLTSQPLTYQIPNKRQHSTGATKNSALQESPNQARGRCKSQATFTVLKMEWWLYSRTCAAVLLRSVAEALVQQKVCPKSTRQERFA